MKHHVDVPFLIISAILILFGVLFLSTLSAPESLQYFGNTNYYLFHQLFKVIAGLVLCLIAFKIPLDFLKKYAFVFLVFNLVLMAIPLLPVLGIEAWGAKRWISIGGFTVQPSEFLKITSILYLSALISHRFSESSKKGWIMEAKKGYNTIIGVLLPFICLLGAVAIMLLLQRDMSTLAVTTISLITVYFIAGTPFWHTIVVFLSGIAGGLFFIKIEPYRAERLLVFLHPETDPLGIGFQLKQSLIALGSGGIFGRGLGMSTQKFGFLPQAMGDSMFAIIGEEIGIFGCVILIGLFLAWAWQALKISNRVPEKFPKLVIIGFCTWIIVQTFMNIASNIGIFPLAGIPLPFFSYGGSHVVSELIAIGIILNISKNR